MLGGGGGGGGRTTGLQFNYSKQAVEFLASLL